jgi:hypothetical protein
MAYRWGADPWSAREPQVTLFGRAKSLRRTSALLITTMLGCAAFAQAPETSLSGELFDEMGGPVIAARASLTAADGHLYLARTTEKGIFRFPRIQQSTYALDLEQSGLCTVHLEKVTVAAGEQKKLPRIVMASPTPSGSCP